MDESRFDGGAGSVDFFFDPMCPYAYQTSLWVRSVRDQRDLTITWRFFSLEEINREAAKKHPWERHWSYGWSQMRIGALVRREQGNDALDRWYAAVSDAFFQRAVPTHDPDAHRGVLADAGFDPDLLDRAIDDDTTHDDVREDHEHLVVHHGGFGVPTLVFPGGHALFGPIVVPAPTGSEALRLWDHVLDAREFPTLFELKKPKVAADLADIAQRFEPYLRARSWRTVQRPAP
jgi:2-hydroxychromene-2-carboxylate isomerase